MKERHIIVYRRTLRYSWLRPYDEFIAGTWPGLIRIVNARRKKRTK